MKRYALGAGAAIAVLSTLGIAVGAVGAAPQRSSAGEPVATAPPAITGQPYVGQTLRTSGGTWSSSTPITSARYQWLRCDTGGGGCGAIGGVVGNSYTLANADVGHTIRVTQTVTNSAGSAAATSARTAVVTSAEPTVKSLPTISGTSQVGQTVSTTGAVWSSATPIKSVSYKWLSCDLAGANCTSIAGATGRSHKIGSSEVGRTLRVQQTATNSSGSATATSRPTSPVTSGGKAVAQTQPTITGAALVGGTLSTNGAQWFSPTAISKAVYQWYRCDSKGQSCVPLAAATNRAYVVVAADENHRLRVVQTVTNSAGSSSATSDATAVVNGAASTPAPGTVQAAQVKLPNRLVIAKVVYSPLIIRSRAPFVGRFLVTDTSGHPVQGAFVHAIGLPYNRVEQPKEVVTGADGWATVQFTPTRLLPLKKGGALVMFVRARTPQGDLLAGASTRRLVQVRLGRP